MLSGLFILGEQRELRNVQPFTGHRDFLLVILMFSNFFYFERASMVCLIDIVNKSACSFIFLACPLDSSLMKAGRKTAQPSIIKYIYIYIHFNERALILEHKINKFHHILMKQPFI